MTNYEAALKWVVQGFSVIPIYYMDKRPEARLLPYNEQGDRSWEIFKTQLPSINQLKMWFPSKLHNLGVVMGWNNLVVVDFDLWDLFLFWHKIFPLPTYMVKTKRGMHVYLQVENSTRNYHSSMLDVKASGYVLVPPSIHPSGYTYEVFQDQPILKVKDLADVLPGEFTPDIAPVHIQLQVAPLPPPDDPWASAENLTSTDMVENVRNRKSLLDFFPGAQRKSNDGRWWVTTCPFHNDHKPSFWIDTSLKICGCYTGCTSKPLDVINLYARLHGLTNRDAIWALAKAL